MKRVSLRLMAILLALGAASPATAQNYPSRTIKVLISTAPGGLLDILPRILGQKITETTGQAVVIENKTGGNGAVAGAEFAKSTPDGYTLMGAFHGVNAILPHMTNLPFDPRTDFAPIVHFLTVPTILVVHPSLPVESVQDLIAYGKANPGKLTYASQGVGSGGHLGGELFKQITGLDIAHVPFRGAAPAAQALVGGQVSMMFDNVTLGGRVDQGRPHPRARRRREVAQRHAAGRSDVRRERPAARGQRLVRLDGADRHTAGDHQLAQPRGQHRVFATGRAQSLPGARRGAAARHARRFPCASSTWNIASGGRSSPGPISGSTEFASKPRSREGMTPTLKPR